MIDRAFIESEIASLEAEKQKAQAFMLQADGALAAWKTMLAKLDEPTPEEGDGECVQSQ